MGNKTKFSGPTCVTAGLLVCSGKDCRKSKGWGDLVEMAGETSRAHEVPCQGLCKGPVVGLDVEGSVHWFGGVKSSKKRTLVERMMESGRVPAKLTDRESRKRRGQVRGQNRMHPLDAMRAEELVG